MAGIKRASPGEVERYRGQGFLCRERVFDEKELEDLRDAAENVHQQVLDAASGKGASPIERVDNQRYQMLCGSSVKWEWREDLPAVRSMEPCHHLDPRFDALIDDARVWGPCRDLAGCEELSLFSDKLNLKRPGGAPFPWHQESPYWAHGAARLDGVVSALLYLDAGTRENGCLWVIRGSHRQGALQGLRDRGVLGALYTDVDLVEGEAVPIEVPAGSVLYFHPDLVHGSRSNRTNTSRRVIVLIYQPRGRPRWRTPGERPVAAP